ncbi:MAG: biotin--[acetyl-CoA-carboxylase] ligase [Candidatus Omnitrophica bacterium]|nr:biotin--[acetyl-CoA-carboxylase] ligase [Candidatus Omnitrophota bacterium]
MEAAVLNTIRIGKRITTYETTDSTMDVAHRLGQAGEPEGSVVAAEGQSRGRGRLGRSWLSPKGKGIYLSVILRPTLQLAEVPRITLMAAVAVARAIQAATGLAPEIKWPNDVLIRGRKVAGILTELNGELNRVNYIVVGIGMNVNSVKGHLPAHTTSIEEQLGGPADRVKLTQALLVELDRAYDQLLRQGFPSILEAWRGFAHFLGRRIRVVAQGRTVDGQAVDVDSDGTLMVRTDTGLVESLSAGEVLVVR